MDVLRDDETAVAAILCRSNVRNEIIAALREWAGHQEDKILQTRLLSLADAVDLDPNGVAARVRNAAKARDPDAVRQLVSELQVESLPPTVIVTIAHYLNSSGNPEDGSKNTQRGVAISSPRFLVEPHAWPNPVRVNYETSGSPAETESLRYRTVAMALRPLSAGTHLNVGNSSNNLNRWDEAEAEYRRALAIKPDYAGAHRQLGGIYEHQLRWKDAEAEYRRALATTQ